MTTQLEEVKKLLKEIKADSCINTRTRNEHPFDRLAAINEKVSSILSIIHPFNNLFP